MHLEKHHYSKENAHLLLLISFLYSCFLLNWVYDTNSQGVMGSGLKLDISKYLKKRPYFLAYYLMGQGSMEGFAVEVMKLYIIKCQVSSLTP
jgi:hypothetical protein